MNRLIEKMFENRGYSRDFVREINDFSHDDLKDVDALCSRLKEIHDTGVQIVILPDFDMDGIMAGVVGFAGMAELGFNVALFMPDPDEGYGFTPDTIMRLLEQYPNVNTILTCDVGITCYAGINTAKLCGVDVLVTDHHNVQSDFKKKMKASVVVDPMREDDTYAHPGICGAYVLYQCLQHYVNTYCTPFEQEQIRRLRVFAGIGTVSDSMPLRYENRQLVRDAVAVCRLVYGDGSPWFVNAMLGHDVYRRAFYGLLVALSMFADIGKISKPSDITEEFFGYYLAPTFNSVKRMSGDMQIAFGVFFGTNPADSMSELMALNDQRKILVNEHLEKIQATKQQFEPYVYITDAPSGILGLIATKLMADDGLPKVVLRKKDDGNGYTGSGRSPAWYLFASRAIEEGFFIAGHENAFGIGITDMREMKNLATFLSKDVQEVYDVTDMSQYELLTPDFVISTDGSGDTGIDITLFVEYLSELETLRPFGAGFEPPVVRLEFMAHEGKWDVLGSTKQHLKIKLPYGFEVLCWNQANKLSYGDSGERIVVTGALGKNEYRGRTTINFTGDIEEFDTD